LFVLGVVRLQDLREWEPAFDSLSFVEAVQRRCALLVDPVGVRHFVITDPFDTDQFGWAMTRFGPTITGLASDETFDAWLAQAEAGMTALGALGVVRLEGDQNDGTHSFGSAESLNLREIGSDASPAIRFVNSTLYDALKIGASDIHLESDPSGLNVKFRIDGVLTAIRRVDNTELSTQAISRIKVMAQLDISERRVPQDGRLQIGYASRNIDVRVSIMPSIHGEDAVLRVLDREHLAQALSGLTLATLGFDGPSQRALHALCRKPHGMMLVTGPTGSGKTTTLYAAIAETHQSRDKIITIEDPVEYQLPGVLQIPVNERKGLTFARGLRSILRHDPDKILVGEIRDAETAQIAVQSALTGHLVFTTVHANTVFDVVGRFDQFGIDAYTFASAINGVLAQRLLRRVCHHCAVDETPGTPRDPALQAFLATCQATPVFKSARGCEHCRGTGYSGRFALGELLTLTPALRELLARRAPQAEIQAAAASTGWRSLQNLAFEAAARGMTTLDEVERVAV
jgi:general secretion pathway protein E